jgi:hypothetical protein
VKDTDNTGQIELGIDELFISNATTKFSILEIETGKERKNDQNSDDGVLETSGLDWIRHFRQNLKSWFGHFRLH